MSEPYIFNATLYGPKWQGLASSLANGANAASASAQSGASSLGQAASHIPHPLNAHFHAPPPTYSSHWHHERRLYRGRGGSRFFPLLLIGGVSLWGYSHLKHRISELEYDTEGLRRTVATHASGGASAQSAQSTVVEDPERRRRHRNHWGWRGEEREQTSRNEPMEIKRI